jgi:hypothetical protein
MKKNSIFMTGMLALLLAFGLVLAGCPTDSDDDGGGGGGGGGGNIDSKLVGKWSRGEGTSNITIEITSAGEIKVRFANVPNSGFDGSVAEDAGTITVSGDYSGTAKWSVSDDGNTLTLTEGTGQLINYANEGGNTFTKQE